MQPVIALIRPAHWIKNLFVVAPLIFSVSFMDTDALMKVGLAFAAFSLAASGVYCVNDLADMEKDAKHPLKKKRPLPSGAVTPLSASLLSSLLFIGAFALVPRAALPPLAIYVGMNFLYSGALKHVALLDVMLIAIGFILRVITGAMAIDVVFSRWIFLTTLFLALFLALAKRRAESAALANDAADQRPSLSGYSVRFLDRLLLVCLSLTSITYALYLNDPDTVMRFGSEHLMFTLPFVLYGMFRYFYLVTEKKEGEDPILVLLKDRPIQLTVLSWGLLVLALLAA